MGLILDHSYRNKGGYQLTPSEIRAYQGQSKEESEQEIQSPKAGDGKPSPLRKPSSDETFQKRRKLLLKLVDGTGSEMEEIGATLTKEAALKDIPRRDGAPFTIQRIAEVIIAPERVSSCRPLTSADETLPAYSLSLMLLINYSTTAKLTSFAMA
jgi:hypothetical protein